jgi:hypothetical protein
MERLPVSSSNIESVGYDSISLTLEVEFKRGGVYQYYEVPSDVYEGFISAESLGSYLHHSIKNNFSVSKV